MKNEIGKSQGNTRLLRIKLKNDERKKAGEWVVKNKHKMAEFNAKSANKMMKRKFF